jgi:olefin beta-lactone synthetase
MNINVASHLDRMAKESPDCPAVYVPLGSVNPSGDTPHRTLTFRELNADANAVADGLKSIGIDRGTRVVLMVPPGVDFFALTFALFKLAAVPVMIDPGMGLKNVGKCLAEAEPTAFIGVAKSHLARRLFGWAKKSIRITVNVGKRRFFCTRSIEEFRSAPLAPLPEPVNPDADDLAAVLFTSGSTGIAKGAEYTHGIFAAQVEVLKTTYGIQPGEVDLCTFPLFALFGPALGMSCVVPDMNPSRPATIHPGKAMSQIRQFGVTNLFGSPAVIRQLASVEKAGGVPTPLATVRRVISAGAPATIPVIERFAQLLPAGVQVFTPYGATEALPVANIGSDEILRETRHLTEQGKGVCIGRPVSSIRVQVIRISDEAIPTWSDTLCVPPGVIGEFVVCGPVVTKRYFRRDEATRLAKIQDLNTGEVLHRMGDVGYIDEAGRFWFCGRKSHRVDTPHGTLFTDMVEPVFNTIEGITRTALVGIKRQGITLPVLCIENKFLTLNPDWSFDIAERVLQFRDDRMPQLKNLTVLTTPRRFPMDLRHNSKIFREKLATWADQTLGPKWTVENTS